jgi:hypothetical protein
MASIKPIRNIPMTCKYPRPAVAACVGTYIAPSTLLSIMHRQSCHLQDPASRGIRAIKILTCIRNVIFV